jgi:WD40 repeat protein/tRNA A-37 threonylcarbamoyl transferase component Bud32
MWQLDSGATAWTPSPGQRKLGRYELLEHLGTNLEGTAYKARDVQMSRVVILHIPRAERLAGEAALERFLKDGHCLAQLSHAGLVAIHDVAHSEGVPYVVGEFVQGPTLADRLAERRPGPHEAAQMVIALADALQYVHEQGLIHRDVRPANIRLELDGTPRLAGFGLMRQEGSATLVAPDGRVLSSPAYRSPEQVGDDSGRLGPRSDVFSLGVILYEMLTGERPFRGTPQRLTQQILHEDPRPPRLLNDDIPVDLERICLKALAKDLAGRYATARDLADDLRRFLKGEPVHVQPLGKASQAWRLVRAYPVAWAVAAGVLAILLAALVLSTVGYFQTAKAWRDAEATGQELAQEGEQTRVQLEEERHIRQEYQDLEHKARLRLRAALLGQADALSQSPQAGNRQRILDVIHQAAAIAPGPELRDQFLRSLALPNTTSTETIVRSWRLPGSPAPRRTVAELLFSPTERWLACVAGGELRMLDLRHPDLQDAVLERTDPRHLAFSPEGDHLWSVHAAGPDSLWQLPSPVPTPLLQDQTRLPQTVAILKTGERAAAGSEAAMDLKVVEVATGKLVWRYGERAYPEDALFSPDGRRFIAVLHGPTGLLTEPWNCEAKAILPKTPGRPKHVFFRADLTLEFSDPATLAVHELQGRTSFPALRVAPPAFQDFAGRFAFSRDGNVCAESAGPQAPWDILVWDLSRKLQRAVIARTGKLEALAERRVRGVTLPHLKILSPDGVLLAAANGEGLAIWDTQGGKQVAQLPAQPLHMTLIDVDSKTRKLIVLDRDGKVLTWKTGEKALTPLCTLPGDATPAVNGGEMTADGSRLVFVSLATTPPTLQVWNLTTGKPAAPIPIPVRVDDREAARWALSPDGSKVAVLGSFLVDKVWNADSGSELLNLSAKDSLTRFRVLSMGREGNLVLGISADDKGQSVRAVDLSDPSEPLTDRLEVPAKYVAVADRALLAAVGQKKDVWVYNAQTRKKIAILEGHLADVTALAFDPDANLLASASAGDQTIRLWNPTTGQPLATMPAGMRSLTRVALSASGRWLAVGDSEGQVRVWDLATARRLLHQEGLDWTAPVYEIAAPPTSGTAAALLDSARRQHLFGHYTEAVADYSKSLKLDPKQAMAFRDRGEAYFQLGRFQDACADFDQAKALNPDLPYSDTALQALQARGLVLAEAGQWPQAVADFAKAIRAGGARANTPRQNALLRLAAGDLPGYKNACDRLLQRLDEKPAPPVANPVIWTCVLGPNGAGDYTHLVEMAEDGVDSYPKEWHYHTTLGAVLCRKGDFTPAMQRLLQGMRLTGGEGHLQDWLFLALAYDGLGHPEEARPYLDKAVRWIEQNKPGRAETPGKASQAWDQRLELLVIRREVEKQLGVATR